MASSTSPQKVSTSPEIYEISTPVWDESFQVNCFAIRSEGEWLLIDTGMPKRISRERLSAALDEIGFDWSRANIALTHMHIDHGALACKLAPAGTKVYLGSRELEFSRTTRSRTFARAYTKALRAEGVSLTDTLSTIAFHWVFANLKQAKVDIVPLDEGDTITVGSLKFEAIDTAGHSLGHTAYYEQNHRIIFGGDHMLHTMLPSIDLFADGSDSVEAYLLNTKKLILLPITSYFVAHGESKPEFKERLQQTLEQHEERLDEFVSIIEREPGLTGFEVMKRIAWLGGTVDFGKVSAHTRSCILCEGTASLNHLVLARRIKREGAQSAKLHRYFLA